LTTKAETQPVAILVGMGSEWLCMGCAQRRFCDPPLAEILQGCDGRGFVFLKGTGYLRKFTYIKTVNTVKTCHTCGVALENIPEETPQ
jgi:hypothetical protein